MCLPFLSKQKVKEAFTAPRSTNGFVVTSGVPSQGQGEMRSRRMSTWSQKEREWKADIERLDREAKDAESRGVSSKGHGLR